MSEKNIGIALLGIIAVGSLGLGGYMFVKNEIFPTSTPSNNGSILVGVWDAVIPNYNQISHSSPNDWFLEAIGGEYNDTRYISTSNENTRFTLLREGYYKINLNALLNGLDNESIYNLIVFKNSVEDIVLYAALQPTSVTEFISGSVCVHSNGTNYFEIVGISPDDSSFGFELSAPITYYYFQFTIEYML